jgi:hypothetical protein
MKERTKMDDKALKLHPNYPGSQRLADKRQSVWIDAGVNQAWGIDVFADIWCPTGKGLLLDTTKLGYVAVRESLAVRVGYAGTDFTQNILRFVGEERLTLCVTRPSAVCAITNLP